jgi:hypothetical protein
MKLAQPLIFYWSKIASDGDLAIYTSFPDGSADVLLS